MLGESPNRQGIFHASPLVVVTLDISPFSFNTEQLMVPVGGCRTLWMASARASGGIPMSAARLYSLRTRSDWSAIGEICNGAGGFQLGSAIPGPHQSWLELDSFHNCHILRECSVTVLASDATFLMSWTAPTAPARRVGPCMQQASSSTMPSSLGSPPKPTLSSL